MSDDTDGRDLVVRYLDGVLTPEEQRRLNDILRADPERRRHFVATCLQASLIRQVAAERGAERRLSRRTMAVRAASFMAVAAAIAIVVVRSTGSVPAVTDIPMLAADRVAIVSRAEGAIWKSGSLPIETGRVLGRGRVELLSGTARIDFFGGAKVSLTGPAVLELVSARRGFLHSGSISARVHEQAVGFILEAPGAKVYDLGTEFSLSTQPTGRSDVRVFRGEVEASVLGGDGTTLESTIVAADRHLLIDPAAARIKESPVVAGVAPVSVDPPAALAIPVAYVKAVIDSHPVGYWRFERVENGLAANELGTAHPLQISGNVTSAGGSGNRVLAFSPDIGPRAVTSDDFPGFAGSDFSIDLWANAESIREMSLASLVESPHLPTEVWNHLALLEFRAMENRISHPPGVVRYLHRWPPGPVGGVNVFSPAPYQPGRWHHVVSVSRGGVMILYLDGRDVGQVAVPAARAPLAMRLVLGILPTLRLHDQRPYVGWLDEVALYDRALGGDEIAARHRLVVP